MKICEGPHMAWIFIFYFDWFEWASVCSTSIFFFEPCLSQHSSAHLWTLKAKAGVDTSFKPLNSDFEPLKAQEVERWNENINSWLTCLCHTHTLCCGWRVSVIASEAEVEKKNKGVHKDVFLLVQQPDSLSVCHLSSWNPILAGFFLRSVSRAAFLYRCLESCRIYLKAAVIFPVAEIY